MTTIYSILSTLNKLEPKQDELQENHEPVEARGSIREGIAAKLEAKLRELKEQTAEGEHDQQDSDDTSYRGINDPDRRRERKWLATDHETLDRLERQAIDRAKRVGEGEVCPVCDSEPCQCEEMGEGNEFSAALAKAKATGATEFEVDGKKYQVEALDTNLLKAIAQGGTKMPHDAESDRNIHKKYGYRGDREEEDDDAYDEWGNLKPGRKASAHVIPGEKRGRGRPKGSTRATGAKFTGKSKLLNMSEARLIDEGGNTLQHILDRFPAEVKSFEQGDDLEDNLYDALFDYYMSSGEMPYGVAKARTGDPYEWITERLVADLGLKETEEIITQETDMDLSELARLAGLKESCGAMSPMTQTGDVDKPEINISTNYNSADDNKSITVTAQGDSAVALSQILKLSGLMGDAPAEEQQVAIVAAHPEHEREVEEERDPEYANTPNEETAGVDAAVPSGNDLHKSKGANPNWHGDNAMRTTQFEENDPIANLGRKLMKEYESIKITK